MQVTLPHRLAGKLACLSRTVFTIVFARSGQIVKLTRDKLLQIALFHRYEVSSARLQFEVGVSLNNTRDDRSRYSKNSLHENDQVISPSSSSSVSAHELACQTLSVPIQLILRDFHGVWDWVGFVHEKFD